MGGRSGARRPPGDERAGRGGDILLAACAACDTASALAVTGDLNQPSATSSCWSEAGATEGPCADGKALDAAVSVAISPDGKNVYVASRGGVDTGVAVFSRNTTTGVLTQLAGTAGCVSETGAGPCADGRALNGAQSVAVSPDGKNVYVASTISDAVARFNRNPTNGALTQPAAATAGCVSETGAGPCADGRALLDASSVAVSGDGKSVYVTSPGFAPAGQAADGVARFNRDTTGATGAITQPAGGAGCVTEDGSGGLCANGKELRGAYSVAVSADGTSVYVAARDRDALTRFNRDTTSGAIVQTANCVSENGVGPCTDGIGLDGASSVALSPDGKSVYVGSTITDGVVRINRNTTSGAIVPTANCVNETGSCGTDGRALLQGNSVGSRFVAVSGDGANVYVASSGSYAVARFNRNTRPGPPPGRSPNPPRPPPAASARRGRAPAPTAGRSRGPPRSRSAPAATTSTWPRP